MAAQNVNLTLDGVFNVYLDGNLEGPALLCHDTDNPDDKYWAWVNDHIEISGSSITSLIASTYKAEPDDGYTFEPIGGGGASGSPDDEFEDSDFIKFKLPAMYTEVVDFPPEFDDCYVGQIHNTDTTYAFVQMYHTDGKMGPRIPFFNLAGKVATTKLDYYPIPKSLIDVRNAEHEDPWDPDSPVIVSDDPELWAQVEVGSGESPAVGEPYVLPSTPQIDLVAAVYSDGSFEVIDEADYSVTPVEGDTVVMIEDPETGWQYVPGTFTYGDFEKKLYVGIVETK